MKINNILEDKYDELPDDDKFTGDNYMESYDIQLGPHYSLEVCYINNDPNFSGFLYYWGERAIEAGSMYELCLKVRAETQDSEEFFERFLYQVYEYVLVSGKCNDMEHMDLLNQIAGGPIKGSYDFVKFMTENINDRRVKPFWKYVDDMLLPR